MNEAAKARVLLVDDLEVNRFLLEEALSGDEFEVRTAASGMEALEIAREFRPDVVLLDFRMPGLNGSETARRLRDEVLGDAPFIILVSGNEDPADPVELHRAGADDFIGKPCPVSEFRRRTREGVETARRRGRPVSRIE